MAFKHHLVLATDQMGVDQGQTGGLHTLRHHGLTLIALADMKGRRVDHCQQLCARLPCQFCRLFKPGIFANQQAHTNAIGTLTCFKYAYAITRLKITALVKHLVIGQLALGIAGHHLAFAQHAGRVEATLGCNRTGARLGASRGMPDHHGHAF